MLRAFRRLVKLVAPYGREGGGARRTSADVLFGIETYEGWASTFADHESTCRTAST